jgi:hypothetical protein
MAEYSISISTDELRRRPILHMMGKSSIPTEDLMRKPGPHPGGLIGKPYLQWAANLRLDVTPIKHRPVLQY